MVDDERKRELKRQYREMRPPMGVLTFRCTATGESFLLASKNVAADTTSVTFKLNSGYHPNRKLLERWRQYGEAGFETEVVEPLEYRDGVDDYADELEALRELCLERDPNAEKLW